MMKTKNLFSLWILLILLTSCYDKHGTSINVINPKSYSGGPEAAQFEIHVTGFSEFGWNDGDLSEIEYERVDGEENKQTVFLKRGLVYQDWLKAEWVRERPETVVVTLQENTSSESRFYRLNLNGTESKAIFPITQAGAK